MCRLEDKTNKIFNPPVPVHKNGGGLTTALAKSIWSFFTVIQAPELNIVAQQVLHLALVIEGSSQRGNNNIFITTFLRGQFIAYGIISYRCFPIWA
ncbi:hypothetical protein BV504_01130 [Halomonas sp. 'Soap Lake |nr:hypothetical protein B2G49_01125 [Halomonas sp. 'Soap Lake \